MLKKIWCPTGFANDPFHSYSTTFEHATFILFVLGSGSKVVWKEKKSEFCNAKKLDSGPIIQRSFKNDTTRINL